MSTPICELQCLAASVQKVATARTPLCPVAFGKFKLTLGAQMKGSSERADIVVREVEVIPNGREQNLVFNGRLENSVQHELNFPPQTE
jgi:hypothetical protein